MRRYNIGDSIQNRYQIHKIFEGGFGVVYICYFHEFRTPVSIKGFKEEFALNERVIERFRQEALEWIELERHQNIVRAFSVDVIEGRPYILLEYIAGAEGVGTTLVDWLWHGRVDYKGALQFAVHIANGMAYAFLKRNLVHRDLKPENILVTSDGTAKVTDFGLAKSVMEGGEQIFPSSALDQKKGMSLLVKGSACGTPPYMPPEQWGQAEKVDTRADIYSFGCVLYEMLTGEPPFGNHNFGDWERNEAYYKPAHLNKRPESPKSKSPAVSAELEKLVMKCLEKKPQRRYESFAQVREVLVGIYQREIGEEIRLEVEPPSLEAGELINKGNGLVHLGRYQEAIGCYDKALEINKGLAPAWSNRGIALVNLRQYQEAIDCYNKALEIDEKNARAWASKGDALANLKMYQEAIGCYDKALEINKGFASDWKSKGNALVNLGQFHEAIDCYDKALAINEKDGNAWINKGVALVSLKRYQEAIACQNKALAIDERDANAWINKGIAFFHQRQYDEAIKCLDRARTLNPALEEICYELIKHYVLMRSTGGKHDA